MAAPIGIIAAVSLDGGIAQDGRIPWDEPADRRHFADCTRDSTVIMGRRTWRSLPGGALPHRTNFVLTRQVLPAVRCFPALQDALAAASGPVWLIGGQQVYQEGMAVADHIELTRVPVRLGPEPFLTMPAIDPAQFALSHRHPLAKAPHLIVERWARRLA